MGYVSPKVTLPGPSLIMKLYARETITLLGYVSPQVTLGGLAVRIGWVERHTTEIMGNLRFCQPPGMRNELVRL